MVLISAGERILGLLVLNGAEHCRFPDAQKSGQKLCRYSATRIWPQPRSPSFFFAGFSLMSSTAA
jgi:hypothetical protein